LEVYGCESHHTDGLIRHLHGFVQFLQAGTALEVMQYSLKILFKRPKIKPTW